MYSQYKKVLAILLVLQLALLPFQSLLASVLLDSNIADSSSRMDCMHSNRMAPPEILSDQPPVVQCSENCSCTADACSTNSSTVSALAIVPLFIFSIVPISGSELSLLDASLQHHTTAPLFRPPRI